MKKVKAVGSVKELAKTDSGPEIKSATTPAPSHVEISWKPLASNKMNTSESDRAAQLAYPQLGDSVRVNLELVPYSERGQQHKSSVALAAHMQTGTVSGLQIEGGLLLVRVETGGMNPWVPWDVVELFDQPSDHHLSSLSPEEQHEHNSKRSPEVMNKSVDGSYNLT